jgi:subtilisin family serine protease
VFDPVEAAIVAAGLGPVIEAARKTSGVAVALIDGPVDIDHPALTRARIEQAVPRDLHFCASARAHATMIASILVGSGSGVLGLCPASDILSLPVVDDRFEHGQIPLPTLVKRLSEAISEAVRRRTHVILISLEFHPEFSSTFAPVAEALAGAAAQGAITVISAGNTCRLGSNQLLLAPGVLPVAMLNLAGRPAAWASYGPAVGTRGVCAPGECVPGAVPGGYASRTGTSYAAAIVTGAVALLRSIFPRRSSHHLIHALRGQHSGSPPGRSVIPPPISGERALALLMQDN